MATSSCLSFDGVTITVIADYPETKIEKFAENSSISFIIDSGKLTIDAKRFLNRFILT